MRAWRARTSLLWLVALLTVALLGASGCSRASDRASPSRSVNGQDGAATEIDGSDRGSAAPRDLCTEVTAAEAAAVAGRQITTARSLPPDLRVSAGSELPGCLYEDAGGLAIVQVEMVSATRWETLMSDPSLALEPIPGVGEEAFVRMDSGGLGRVIGIYVRDGEDHWEIRTPRGLMRDDAVAFAKLVTGR